MSEYEDNNGDVNYYDHCPDDFVDDDESWCITDEDDSHKYDDCEDDRIIISSDYDYDDDESWCITNEDDEESYYDDDF